MMRILQVANLLKRSLSQRLPTQCKSCDLHRVKDKNFSTRPLHEVNTNVSKDVILFKYENPKFYKYMNIFALVQYMFWTYLGIFSFTSLRDTPIDQSKVDETTPWFRKINLGDSKYKNTLGIASVVIGVGSLAIVWMYTLRSVRYLILHKGGQHLTFVLYTPLGKNRLMKVPLQDVCCKQNRTTTTVQLPLKVKNRYMHYMLDMRGEFKNPVLFDCTAGLFRKI